MPRHVRWFALTLFATLVTVVSGIQAAVPDLAYRSTAQEETAPAWVSEGVAIVDGELDVRHFSPGILVGLESRIENARRSASSTDESGCSTYSEPGTDRPGRFKGSTVKGVLGNAAEVYAGRITDVRQGFLFGRPGTLVEIALDDTADAHQRAVASPVVYAFLRIAKIEVGGVLLCTGRTENRPPPGLGRSAVLALDAPLSEERILARAPDGAPIVQPMSYEMFFEDATGKASAFGQHKHHGVDPSALRAAAEQPERR